ncbi:MAG: hypothetical protein HeimC3_36790 [Candidatus Heimdallarchaeota archaeon LC_3]|nr:MAG: hypothetical protein HeimC3_36790 [Candidatus Heimdallarchaeota archaeon LC_3]
MVKALKAKLKNKYEKGRFAEDEDGLKIIKNSIIIVELKWLNLVSKAAGCDMELQIGGLKKLHRN